MSTIQEGGGARAPPQPRAVFAGGGVLAPLLCLHEEPVWQLLMDASPASEPAPGTDAPHRRHPC